MDEDRYVPVSVGLLIDNSGSMRPLRAKVEAGSLARLHLTVALAMLLGGAATDAQQTPQFAEHVDVARTIVDVRVLDDHGDAITGLTADDFRVTIDGKAARVETATWVGEASASPPSQAPAPLPGLDAIDTPVGQGRLIVFLVQKDFEASRIRGLMAMLPRSSKVALEALASGDRLAILSFDTSLHIWTDFTSDRERLEQILTHDILLQRAPVALASAVPSLIERLDLATASRTYGIERALELIGNALEPLAGSKSLVLLAYGFGRLGPSGVEMENGYGAAREALVAARTSVFSIDITDADYHSLEAGLQLVSEQTGGFYARTNLFPGLAMRQLTGALAGYYALFVENPDGQHDVRGVKTELTRRKGRVLALSGDMPAAR